MPDVPQVPKLVRSIVMRPAPYKPGIWQYEIVDWSLGLLAEGECGTPEEAFFRGYSRWLDLLQKQADAQADAVQASKAREATTGKVAGDA